MKYILLDSYEDWYEDPMGYSECRLVTNYSIKAFKSKKDILPYLQKNILEEDGKTPFNYKTIKEYLEDFEMRIFPYKYIDYVVEKYRVRVNDIDLKNILDDRKTNY